MKFKPGDIVKLRSGGPPMTVVKFNEENHPRPFAVCRWFDGDNLETAIFEPPTIAIVDLVDIGKGKAE